MGGREENVHVLPIVHVGGLEMTAKLKWYQVEGRRILELVIEEVLEAGGFPAGLDRDSAEEDLEEIFAAYVSDEGHVGVGAAIEEALILVHDGIEGYR